MDRLSPLRELNRRIGRRFLPHSQKTRIRSGPPPGLPLQTLEAVLHEHYGDDLRTLRHEHLSGWKSAGAYRLHIRTTGGSSRSLVYKRAVYDPEETPALREFPLAPGPPEFLIYRSAVAALEPYLPRRTLCREIREHREYEYLFEDLNATHTPLSATDDQAAAAVSAAARLPLVHAALREWSAQEAATADLLRYDEQFACRLQRYARTAIERYARATSSDIGRRVIEAWPRIEDRHLAGVPSKRELTPIHGDFNRSNIHWPRDETGPMKLVDWEWSGFGLPEADLVSLTKGLPSPVLDEALGAFAGGARSPAIARHRTRIDWCLLDRGILDAAFLANEYLARWRPPDWVLGSIEGALAMALSVGGA